MVELTKSMLSFSWAQTLFGAEQLMNLSRSPGSAARGDKAAAGFDAVAYRTADQLTGILNDAFLVGDQFQRLTVDAAFGLLTRRGLDLNAPARLTGELLRQSLDAFQILLDPQALRLAWQELRDKLQVFQWVRSVQSLLHLDPNTSVPLPELVDRAHALGDFP